jgi:DNA-binding NarL/FixJ family response regulator
MTVNAFSMGSQDLELLPAGGVLHLDHASSFLEIRKDDLPVEPFHDGRSTGVVEHGQKTRITVIDENALSRSCLMRCLVASEADFATEGYRNVEEWRQVAANGQISIVLLCATGQKSTEIAVRRDVDFVTQNAPEARVIVVSDLEDPAEIVGALERGARGYISMSSNLDVAIAAIRLVRAGGTFVPASGLLSSRGAAAAPAAEVDTRSKQRQNLFTQRQLEVIDRLRKGESNKLIAYKLNMGECTVKVHVRNIMRKIKARNRTEIAFLTNELF